MDLVFCSQEIVLSLPFQFTLAISVKTDRKNLRREVKPEINARSQEEERLSYN